MSVNANLKQITFQSSLRSKPVRENFTDTENALNDLQSQINALATPPAGTEVTNARDNHTVLRDRLRSESMINGNVLISGGVVSDQAVPDMTVHIDAGEAIVDGVACKWSAQDSGTITAPVSNTRLDYVVVNSDNSISIVAGTPGASPVFPTVASSQLVVAALVVKAATTSMNDGAEIFNLSNGGDLYYPNVYVNSATTLSSNLNYNNLIVDAVKFDTASYAALCQGNAHLVSVNNAGVLGSQLSSSPTNGYSDSSNYLVNNYAGDSLTAGSVPKLSEGTLFKAPSSSAAYNLKIRAFNIYVYGTCNVAGTNGTAGTNNNTWVDAQTGSGEDGGDGGNGATVLLEAINELTNNGTINANGSNGGAGKACSAGTEINVGGAGGAPGDGGTVALKAKTITAGTVTYAGGTAGAGGVGSGGSIANKTGTTPSNGTPGSSTQTIFALTSALPTDYADWIRSLGGLR